MATAPLFPVKNPASSCSVPRATVPSTSGRAVETFLTNRLSRSGCAVGVLCMSWRHPVAASKHSAATTSGLWLMSHGSGFNITHLGGVEPFEEFARLLAIEFRVRRFDEQEELVAAGPFEARHVEDRVIG